MYIAIEWAGIFILFIGILYIISRKPSYYQITLLMCFTSLLIWAFGYLIELQGIQDCSFHEAFLGTRFSYIGKPYVLLTIFLFLAEYSNIKIGRKFTVCLVVIHTIIALAAFTSNTNGLFYTYEYLEPSFGLALGHGPLYFVYMATVAGYSIANLYIGVRSIRAAKTREEKIRAVIVCSLIFIGVGGFIIFLTGVTNGYDATLPACIVSAIILLILFWKYRLFDSLTLSRERMLDDIEDGFVVVNAIGKVEYYNAKAADIFPGIDNGRTEGDVIKALNQYAEKAEMYFCNESVYKISSQNVIEKGVNYGTVYEANDITQRYYYTELLQKEVEEKTRDIKNIQLNVTESFAAMVEARDSVTGDHVNNTTKYVKLLTEELLERKMFPDVVDREFADLMVIVAPLHDIGKISIPDNILNKPGKLDKDEFEIIKTHSVKGAAMIDEIFTGVESDEYVNIARDVVRHHHERWDGSGYPDKLTGEEIPVSAQIMSICDVYDALRSERPYKKGFSKEKTLEILRSERGKQFNTDILDVFLDISRKLEE